MTKTDLLTEMLAASIVNEMELRDINKSKSTIARNRKKIQEVLAKHKIK